MVFVIFKLFLNYIQTPDSLQNYNAKLYII